MAPDVLEARYIVEVELKDCFSDPLVDVMNFLNQIVMTYPGAISFAPGQPLEEHFYVERSLQHILEFECLRDPAANQRRRCGRIWANTAAPMAPLMN